VGIIVRDLSAFYSGETIMRVLTIIFITIIAVCAALTVYEIPNVRRTWQCAHMAKCLKRKFTDKARVRVVLSNEDAATDPEAADILTYCLTEPNDEHLAGMVARYPRNEFFLAQMAYKLTEANFTDLRAALALADRLIAINPNNAHYRYIKGWVLLKPPRDFGLEQDALEQFELGNGLDDFYLPYSNYKQRVDKLLDDAYISPLDRRRSEPSETGIYWDLVKFMSRAYGTYPKLDRESFHNLSAAVASAGERLVNNARHDGDLDRGILLVSSCERVRLRYLDLSPAEAQRARFRLSQSEEIKSILSDRTMAVWVAGADLMKLGLVSAVFSVFFLPPSFPFVWFFLVVINGLRGRAKDVSVGITTPILFVTGLAGYFGLTILYGVSAESLPARFLAVLMFIGTTAIVWIVIALLAYIRTHGHTPFGCSRQWAARICKVLWLLGAIADAVTCSLLLADAGIAKWLAFAVALVYWSGVCVVFWGLIAFRHHILRIITDRGLIRNRFGQLVFVLLLMAGILGILRPIPVVPWILAFFTILLVGLVSVQTPVGLLDSLYGVRSIFSREGPIVIARTKIARMMFAILLLVWIVLLVGVQMSGSKISRVKSGLTDTLSAHQPLPAANRETYERVLSRKYSDDPDANPRAGYKEDVGLPMEFYLVSPGDLNDIISERYSAGRPIREKMLLNLMQRGGHDIRPIVVKTLKDPNALNVLITRAKWKDASVKEPLERTFQDKIVELDKTMAPIREDPNSVRSLIVRCVWGDEPARRRLQRAAQSKLVELSQRLHGQDNDGELKSEFKTLLEIDSILHQTSPVRRLINDANMPELLEDTSQTETSGPELLTSLFEVAGALAFLSNPQEAKERFSRLIDLVAPPRDSGYQVDLQQSSNVLLKAWAGQYRECLFYRSLTGVPKPKVTELLKEYMQRRQFNYPFDDLEFLDVFSMAGDRELAEWVFRNVAESHLTVQVTEYPDLVPTLSPIDISDVKNMRTVKRSKDMTDRYLEPTFPYLSVESIPLLLEHLDSDNEQLRAFIVWRVTSLGYEWSEEQLAALRQDSFWKVRMNALFAFDRDGWATFAEDENALVRTVAQMLIHAEKL
jgi:hypothetical protein